MFIVQKCCRYIFSTYFKLYKNFFFQHQTIEFNNFECITLYTIVNFLNLLSDTISNTEDFIITFLLLSNHISHSIYYSWAAIYILYNILWLTVLRNSQRLVECCCYWREHDDFFNKWRCFSSLPASHKQETVVRLTDTRLELKTLFFRHIFSISTISMTIFIRTKNFHKTNQRDDCYTYSVG